MNLGAHGRAPTNSGSNGCLAPRANEIATSKAFSGMGAKEGTNSNIPARDRAGAFTVDESCREYTGNPRDAAGSYGRSAAPNGRKA